MTAARGQNGFACPVISERLIDEPRPLKVIHVGAGVSGVIGAIQLRKQVPTVELVMCEKNADVGGTWYENRQGTQDSITLEGANFWCPDIQAVRVVCCSQCPETPSVSARPRAPASSRPWHHRPPSSRRPISPVDATIICATGFETRRAGRGRPPPSSQPIYGRDGGAAVSPARQVRREQCACFACAERGQVGRILRSRVAWLGNGWTVADRSGDAEALTWYIRDGGLAGS